MEADDDGKQKYNVALAGNPNCGKTTIFNELTGARESVGNYSGVTVEKIECETRRDSVVLNIVDLPGVYSLTTLSKEELVARNYLLQEHPDAIINVVDASNLARNLFLTLQLKELGIPIIVALNMGDLAEARGRGCDSLKLAEALGVPTIDVLGINGEGLVELTNSLVSFLRNGSWNALNAAEQVDKSKVSAPSKDCDGASQPVAFPNIPVPPHYSNAVETEIERIEAALDGAVWNAKQTGRSLETPFGVIWQQTGRSITNCASRSSFIPVSGGGANKNDSIKRSDGSSDDLSETQNSGDSDSFELEESFPSGNASLKRDAAANVRRRWTALKLLEDDEEVVASWDDPALTAAVSASVNRLADGAIPTGTKFAAERYGIVKKICNNVVSESKNDPIAFSDRVDSILTRPLWGVPIFLTAMYLVFWLTFALGNIPVGWLETGLEHLTDWLNSVWKDSPDSLLRSALVDGLIGGVGGVLVFFPNIFILFAAISALEESGYMARGAFLTDRFLSLFGLRGKSFIPMLVGFGCSVPAILSTRIVDDKRARLTTIFVVPLMSCGARFPIYILIIPAFFAPKWQAPILWSVYFAGIAIAILVAKVLSWTTFRGERSPLLIELPAYRAPKFRTVGVRALERGWQYLHKAGTVILGISLVLWAASTFPSLPQNVRNEFVQSQNETAARAAELGVDLTEPASEAVAENVNEVASATDLEIEELRRKWDETASAKAEARLEHSVAGRIGKAIEPIVHLAGFDWRIGTALIGALAAKELFVAQLGIVFKVGETGDDNRALQAAFAKNYSPLVGICIILFSLVGAPCVATFAAVSKEASLRWAFVQWGTLTALGFLLAVVVYQLGTWFQIGV